MRRLLLTLPVCFCAGIGIAAEPELLVLQTAQTAGIDGRAWDKTFPGALTVDAVHRSVLLRFPGAAEQIAARLAEGQAVQKIEVVFPYAEHEMAAEGYHSRAGMMIPKLTADPPRWHVVAWALRRPWLADADLGPTYNAYLNGAGYWGRFGAADPTQDRFPTALRPVEVSQAQPEGRLDVTTLATDAAYGADLGTRLRALEEQGLLLKKLETYDARYRVHGWDPYEWATPTGGHGLSFETPRLKITLAAGPKTVVVLPTATDPTALAARLAADGTGGAPTAVMPTPDEIKALAARHALQRPAWMPAWQWARVQELRQIGGGVPWAAGLESGDPAQYDRVVQNILMTLPRYWRGWGIQDDLLLWYVYGAMLPEPVREHIRLFWASWLMPEVPSSDLIHPITQQHEIDLWAQNPRWYGHASFFRAGFTNSVSTMNFNHIASMGALLGGSIIDAEHAMADGRHGLEHLLLRFYIYHDGTTQETLDHYYLGITLSAQKMFADFGPTALDRLMGRMILDRQVELLASAYHPNLRRLIGSSGRTHLPFLFLTQDGIYHMLHTLSPKGALLYPDLPLNAKRHDMPVFAIEFPAGRAAIQSVAGPWAPAWVSNTVDEKTFPFEVTATETTRGHYKPPLWQRVFLGRHYGLASQDIKGGVVDVMAQWNSSAEPATAMEQLGTLTLRYSINTPNMSKTYGGAMPYAGGIATFQHKNRAIICTKPRTEQSEILKIAGEEGVMSLSTSLALWNFRETPDWEVYVDGARVTQFPVAVQHGQLITIKDGVSYLAIIPLPATDLGRTQGVVIKPGELQDWEGEGQIAPALQIESYNLLRDTPMDSDAADWDTITTAAYGGFVVELGDVTEYQDFAAFQKQMQANVLTTRWEAEKKTLHISYRSGTDLLEMGFCTAYGQGTNTAHFVVTPGQHTVALPYRRVNGQWPYLPEGIDRDTTLAQQGRTGLLEKQGAVLTSAPGKVTYLQTEPVSGTYTGYNPFPDPMPWALSVPGGVEVRADGQVSMLRVSVRPKENTLWVDYAPRADQSGPEMATSLLLFGLQGAPTVEVNGKLLDQLATVQVEGNTAHVIPLAGPLTDAQLRALPERMQAP